MLHGFDATSLGLIPSLTIMQDWNHYTNTLVVKYKDIHAGNVNGQKTTTHQTVIKVAHKYRWRMQVENDFQFLCDNNTGTLPGGRTFGEVFEYFILGGDDTCFMDLKGRVRVVGDKENTKVPSIMPFFSCCYRLPQNWLLVINPLFSFL